MIILVGIMVWTLISMWMMVHNVGYKTKRPSSTFWNVIEHIICVPAISLGAIVGILNYVFDYLQSKTGWWVPVLKIIVVTFIWIIMVIPTGIACIYDRLK